MKKRIISFLLAAVMLVSAIFTTAISAEETLYPDVASDRWSAADIAYVTEMGMMKDTGDGEFEPAKAVTRAMVVTVLHRMAGEPAPTQVSAFTDVAEGQWYADPVAWGAENELVMGFSDDTFKPNDPVTREQLVTFIGRYAKMGYVILNGVELDEFSDSGKIRDYALEFFKWAVKVGLVKGVTEDEIRPSAGATREQFAAIMHRFDTSEVLEYELKYNEPTLHSQYTEKEYPLVDDADFYVATDGNDSNPGTIDKPFKTFEKARDAVCELKKTATEEIVVAFKAGNYGYLDNITFTPEDSGTAEVPITYCKYGDGDVVFSNGVTVFSEEFKPIEESEFYLFPEKSLDSISKAYIGDRLDKIGQYTVLFGGDSLCWEARYPNKVDGIDQYIIDMTTRVDQFKSIELQYRAKSTANSFRTTEGMKITGHLRTGWIIDTFLVESYDKETGILEFDFDNPDFDSFGKFPMTKWDHGIPDENGDLGEYVLMYEERYDDSIFFHNLSDQLDQAGEYWIDPDTMTLYVYDANGDYTFSEKGTLLTVQDGAEHISFVGLDFSGSTEIAINVFGDSITFDLCSVGNVSGRDCMNIDGVTDVTVKNCEFYNFGAYGVRLNSTRNTATLESNRNSIYNNYFHNFGYIDYFSAAVIVADTGLTVSHNVFENGAHGGVQYQTNYDLTIEYNVFDRLMLATEDFGCIYTGNDVTSRGNVVRYNLFKNIENGAKYAIYLDEEASGNEIIGNIFYKCPGGSVVMNGGRVNTLKENIVINSGGFSTNPGIYRYITEGTVSQFAPGNREYDDYFAKPAVGEPGYELWFSRWPELYSMSMDPADVGDPNCVFTTVNYYDSNLMVGGNGVLVGGDTYERFGVMENEMAVSTDENPVFVNPTVGDYRIREDADFHKIPFEKIGRE